MAAAAAGGGGVFGRLPDLQRVYFLEDASGRASMARAGSRVDRTNACTLRERKREMNREGETVL